MSSNRAELYGESIFTSFRSYGDHIPGLELHFERLRYAVSHYFLDRELSLEEFKSYFNLSSESFSRENSYFRVSIFANTNDLAPGKKRFSPVDLQLKLLIRPMEEKNTILSVKKVNYKITYIDPKIKLGSLGQNLFYKRQAKKESFDDALFAKDRVTELSTSSILFEDLNGFHTPSFGESVFESISIKLFKEFCEKNSLNFNQREIGINELKLFKKAYAFNCVQGVSCIRLIDQLEFESDMSEDMKNFESYLRGEHE